MNKAVIGFLLIVLSVAARAEELKICGVEWPPFTYQEGGNITRGITFDVYTAAFKRLGWTVQMDSLPWPRCLKYVEEGVYDAVIDSVARDIFVNGSHPTSLYPLAIYVRADHPDTDFSWELMQGRSVMLVNGYFYSEKIQQFDGWHKVLVKDEEHMLTMLENQRYEYGLLDIISAPEFIERAGVDVKYLSPLVDSSNLYLAFNAQKEDSMRAFDAVIGQMIDEGEMDAIYNAHVGFGYSDLLAMSERRQ